jgi:hypothetical protein
MPDNNEKYILEGIKQSIENETPDVWENIKRAEKCKYEPDKKSYNPGIRNFRWIGAAAAACVIIVSVGLGTKLINPSGYINLTTGNGSGTGQTAMIAPGTPEISTGRDSAAGSPEIYKPFIKDMDLNEASKALNLNIAAPTWLPDGFSKVSSKLYCMNEDGSKPYMYIVEYRSPSQKVLALSVSKYMTEEEKIKSQPGSIPELAAKNLPAENVPGTAADISPVPPDYIVKTDPGYNPSAPASPPSKNEKPSNTQNASDTPAVRGGESGSTGAAVSVEVKRVKIKDIDVDMTITGESKVPSAYWVYNGGSYNMSSDGIPKDDMTKIIESMIK